MKDEFSIDSVKKYFSTINVLPENRTLRNRNLKIILTSKGLATALEAKLE